MSLQPPPENPPQDLEQALGWFVHRGERSIAALREELETRHPQQADLIGLAAEFCELAEAAEDEPLERIENYDLVSELGRGAFGTVWKAWDRELQRFVALKVLEPRAFDSATEREAMLDEARSAAAIDHPNIVQVHRAGFAEETGCFFIDSQLVTHVEAGASDEGNRDVASGAAPQGARPLDEAFATTRPDAITAARLVLQVCRGVAAAHARGIVHRDLKPANVILAPSGRPMVTDFGLASSVRYCERAASGDTALTLVSRSDGVVGTPAFMAPEQARGVAATAAMDVYGLGGLLAWLLTGDAPFGVDPTAADPVDELLTRVRTQPSRVLAAAHGAPATLVAIAHKAMAFAPEARYDSAEAVAADLGNFLAHRPASVDPPSVWFAVRKAIARNRTLAAILTLAVLLVGTFAGVSLYTALQRIRLDQQMLDIHRFDNLMREYETLWPRRAERLPAMRDWLRRARALLAKADEHRQILAALKEGAAAPPQDLPDWTNRARLGLLHDDLEDWRHRLRIAPDDAERKRAQQAIASAERQLRPPQRTDEQWQLDVFTELVAGLRRLEQAVADVDARATFAASIEAQSVESRQNDWQKCIAAVRVDPRFDGYELRPIVGLVPLGEDPDSKLQEFAHPGTGTLPTRNAAGRLEITDATGLVFVLLPGGTFAMGAQPDTSRPDFYRGQESVELPRHEVTLAPFLLAKFEMTMRQWHAVTGVKYGPSTFPGKLDAVESVGWEESVRALARVEMTLPTEAQWEFAARGGQTTIWYTGNDPKSLAGQCNLRDAALDKKEPGTFHEKVLGDDGFAYVAPVVATQANPFGLHGMLGNVSEWCLDWYEPYTRETAPGSGRRIRSHEATTKLRLIRGGSWMSESFYARSSARRRVPADQRHHHVGVRPCIRVE